MNISETAAKIKSMEIRGAGKIARSAAQALKEFAISLEEANPDKFISELTKAKETLKNTRPTAVSLENALIIVMTGAKGTTAQEIRNGVITAADEFVSSSFTAVEKIAELCAVKIIDNCTILTHCNSNAVIQSIIKAHKLGKKIRVYATETRPWGQGYITTQSLADTGVDVTLIVDSAARFFMDKIDIIIIGADTITLNGSIINKIGTSQIATCAYEWNIPVYVCAETYKISGQAKTIADVQIEERDPSEIITKNRLKGVNIRNPVFDATPSKYIKSIITEKGEISPNELSKII